MAKRGRKPLDVEDKLKRFTIYLSDLDRARLQRLAEVEGKPASVIVREVLHNELDMMLDPDWRPNAAE